MRMMYKEGQAKAVHNAKFSDMKADGWSFTQENQNVRQEIKQEKASEEARQEKEVTLTKTHKKALELGLEIEDENGDMIHHKTLAKQIREALTDGNED